jgi:hypothetical protein
VSALSNQQTHPANQQADSDDDDDSLVSSRMAMWMLGRTRTPEQTTDQKEVLVEDSF